VVGAGELMRIAIHSIENKGDLEKECVWFDVKEEVPSLSDFMVCDTTYTDDHHISNELRHIYWFRKQSVKKGDWIKLLTKVGTNTSSNNDRKTTTHILYWNLGRTIWNKDGDAAVLFELANWNTTKT
jgi:hypothetical protein